MYCLGIGFCALSILFLLKPSPKQMQAIRLFKSLRVPLTLFIFCKIWHPPHPFRISTSSTSVEEDKTVVSSLIVVSGDLSEA